jgi:hypothetical protein
VTDEQRSRPRNPPGRGQLAVFPRCSLDPYDPVALGASVGSDTPAVDNSPLKKLQK